MLKNRTHDVGNEIPDWRIGARHATVSKPALALELLRHAGMRGGSDLGLYLLFPGPTGTGAGGGIQPPHSWRAARYPRIWDAGAAMGQEPYTLAIMFADRMGHFAFNNLRIDATRRGKHRPVRPDDRGRPVSQGGTIAIARRHPGEVLRTGRPTRALSRDRQDPATGHFPAARSSVIAGNRSGIFGDLVQERAAPLPADRRGSKCFACSIGRWRPAGSLPPNIRRRCRRELDPLFERVIPDGPLFRKLESAPCVS